MIEPRKPWAELVTKAHDVFQDGTMTDEELAEYAFVIDWIPTETNQAAYRKQIEELAKQNDSIKR